MALFELTQSIAGGGNEASRQTFKNFVASDIDATFFNADEHAELHTVDGKEALVILEEDELKRHASHWEAGAKQNFDTGLYTAHTILYIRANDYGRKPKVGKELILDQGTSVQRSFVIRQCEEESGVFRMTMERTRQ